MIPLPDLWRRAGALASAVALLTLAGCATESQPGPRPSAIDVGNGTVDEINLLASPVALNFDQTAEPDGFVVKIYFGNRRNPKPIPVETGRLELLMFDGGYISNGAEPSRPKRVWSFDAADLKNFRIETSIGVGYQLAPVWGDSKPTQNKIAVVARFTSVGGAALSSAPSIIAVALR